MKLNEERPYLETSGELEEQFFSIQDTGMIFDILRNKMYSNPILAICREISCNARDAHREVGRPEVPVHIHLPNTLEPYYKIKDFGPGISPDRMSNIFIKYTASTKRSDNVQTGGFGLGAKTPFSYSDTFSIITNHNGTKYSYNCLIDETKVGKLMLASEAPTKEPNGTEIIIPVLPKNFNEFKMWTEQACRHWDVKPTIKGGDIQWQKLETILEGDKWAITATKDYNRSAKMVIDGIEYPLDIDVLKKYADGSLIDSSRGNFIMYFGVGELSLSASREQIYLDEKTQKVIRKRMLDIQKEIRQRVVDKIETFPNLWIANVYYRTELRNAFHDVRFLGQLQWKGIDLSDKYIGTICPAFSFVKGKYSRRGSGDPNKLSRGATQNLGFEADATIIVNDLTIKEPTARHVRKAFDDNPKLKTAYVLCPTDKITIKDLNDKIHLDKMEPIMLSTLTKASGRAYTPASSRLIVFKFDPKAAAFRQVSYASIEEDPNLKTLCVLTKDRYNTNIRNVLLKNKQTLGLNNLKSLSTKFPKYSFYGLDQGAPADRIEEDFSDFEDIEDFIQEQVLDTKQINFLEIKFAQTQSYHLDKRMVNILSQIRPLIKETKSLYLQTVELHEKLKQMASHETGILEIYESVNGEIKDTQLAQFIKDNPQYDVESLNSKFKTTYPLLEHVQTYNYNSIVPHVAEYINLIDRTKENLSNV